MRRRSGRRPGRSGTAAAARPSAAAHSAPSDRRAARHREHQADRGRAAAGLLGPHRHQDRGPGDVDQVGDRDHHRDRRAAPVAAQEVPALAQPGAGTRRRRRPRRSGSSQTRPSRGSTAPAPTAALSRSWRVDDQGVGRADHARPGRRRTPAPSIEARPLDRRRTARSPAPWVRRRARRASGPSRAWPRRPGPRRPPASATSARKHRERQRSGGVQERDQADDDHAGQRRSAMLTRRAPTRSMTGPPSTFSSTSGTSSANATSPVCVALPVVVSTNHGQRDHRDPRAGERDRLRGQPAVERRRGCSGHARPARDAGTPQLDHELAPPSASSSGPSSSSTIATMASISALRPGRGSAGSPSR